MCVLQADAFGMRAFSVRKNLRDAKCRNCLLRPMRTRRSAFAKTKTKLMTTVDGFFCARGGQMGTTTW